MTGDDLYQKCDKCEQLWTALHWEAKPSGVRWICCVCYVNEGNPPAAWHRACMKTWHALKRLDA